MDALTSMISDRDLSIVACDVAASSEPCLKALGQRAISAGDSPDRLAARETLMHLRDDLRNAWDSLDRAAAQTAILNRYLS